MDLDFLPWKTISLKHPEYRNSLHSDAYTPHLESDGLVGRVPGQIPVIQETKVTSSEKGKKVLSKDLSISVENLSERGNLTKSHLEVCAINESCRAYSDSQLAPNAEGPDGVEQGDHTPSPSASSHSLFNKSQDRHHPRAKLSAAKLHLKSLFGQVRCLVQYSSGLWKMQRGAAVDE